MMVGQRTRRTREYTGPAPQSVAIVSFLLVFVVDVVVVVLLSLLRDGVERTVLTPMKNT